ncbi:MAG TPA: GAF domain-containing protein, partial [Flavisolibacter sp.]|nr:GAF domain-containing protein [Flavisolibacter sp.]
DCPMAAISFIDKERQWFKASRGLTLDDVPQKLVFCTHTMLEDDVMVVTDAAADPRFCESPFVTGKLGIRFYAGAPIVSPGGYPVGTLCVFDRQPKTLTPQQQKALSIMSQQIARLLELRIKNKVLKSRASQLVQGEKDLFQKTLLRQEEERFTISTELHENIAQGLAATKIYLEMAGQNSADQKLLLQEGKNILSGLIEEVRQLSRSITPSTLKNFDLEALLTTLLQQFSSETGMQTELLYEGDATLPADTVLALYRIVQEQLENVRLHADASRVCVNVNAFRRIDISIRDNGVGVNTSLLQKGTGINKMLTRVEAMNGVLDINGSPRNGCLLTVSIPLPPELEPQLASAS